MQFTEGSLSNVIVHVLHVFIEYFCLLADLHVVDANTLGLLIELLHM